MSRRSDHELPTQSSLDYPEEKKTFGMGPFTPDEEIINLFLAPFTIFGIVIVVWIPIGKFIGAPGIVAVAVGGISLLVSMMIFPRFMLAWKKGKPKAWLFDAAHRRRSTVILSLIRGNRHFPRPKGTQIFTNKRTLIKGGWTRARHIRPRWWQFGQKAYGLFVHTKPEHLTLGLPPVRIYDSKTQSWGPSITPQGSGDGMVLMHHTRRPGARRIPDHLVNAVIGRDANGHAPIQDYIRTYTPWKAAPGKHVPVIRPAPEGLLTHEPGIQVTNTIARHERGSMFFLIFTGGILAAVMIALFFWVMNHQLAYETPGVYLTTPMKIHWGSHD